MSFPRLFKEFFLTFWEQVPWKACFPVQAEKGIQEKSFRMHFYIVNEHIPQIRLCNSKKGASLQDHNACASGGETVGTKYGYIKLWFWKDSKVQNLHIFWEKSN